MHVAAYGTASDAAATDGNAVKCPLAADRSRGLGDCFRAEACTSQQSDDRGLWVFKAALQRPWAYSPFRLSSGKLQTTDQKIAAKDEIPKTQQTWRPSATRASCSRASRRG